MSHPDSSAAASPRNRRSVADILHTGVAAWVILGLSLAITVVAWQLSSNFAEQRARERFDFQVDEAQFAILKRLTDYEQVLRGGIGLFQAQPQVTREQWHSYVSSLQIDKGYAGIQGIGFSKWILARDKEAHIRQIRAEGYPDYTLRPPGERADYTAIVFLEPFDWRNQRAFGFDMFSEPTRRAAMSRARDTGETAMSGKVTLVQETKKDAQNGFLMYLPLYRKGSALDSVEQRRAALEGFVYSPFRMRDLMQGILGKSLPEIEFEIFDTDQARLDESTLLYASTGAMQAGQTNHPATFANSRPLEFGGHTWTVSYHSNDVFDAATRSSQPIVVALGGVIIDLLLFYIIVSLAKLRTQALALAEERHNKLQESKGEFKAITDSAHEGIASMDDEGRIIYFNQALARMFDHTDETLTGHALVQLVAPEFRDQISTALASTVSSDKPLEVLGCRSDGGEFPLEVSLAKWSYDGRTHASAVLRDLTERKRIDRMKNEFISTVSHELRTPLTAIRGSLGLIQGTLGHTLDEGARNLVNIANSNAERLVRLINDILDIDKLDSGELRLNLQVLSVSPLLEQALQAHAAMATQAGVKLELTECQDARIRVDADRFQQVMVNLLGNAIKFSPPGGAVCLSAVRQSNSIHFTISDEGPGIPQEFRSRIFQKFAQADSSDTRSKGGTGLGLNIAKALVERFGGTIGYIVHTRSGETQKGTTFYFDLPLA